MRVQQRIVRVRIRAQPYLGFRFQGLPSLQIAGYRICLNSTLWKCKQVALLPSKAPNLFLSALHVIER